MYPHIETYNRQWIEGVIDKPLVILIGGYAGTGKSTLAKKLADYFPFAPILQTALLRTLMRTQISQQQNPFLHVHTYDLSAIVSAEKNLSLEEKYKRQVEPIGTFVNGAIVFAGTEKQQRIIEGAHLLPTLIRQNSSVILIEFYLQVPDGSVHKRTISGPTHNRKLTAEQFRDARILHDYIVREAKAAGKEVYRFDEAYERSLQYIDRTLARTLHIK